MDGVGGVEWCGEVEHLFVVDEDAHVRADAVLFVHHAEADSRIPAVEIFQQFLHGRARGLNLGLVGVGVQRAGNEDFHQMLFPSVRRLPKTGVKEESPPSPLEQDLCRSQKRTSKARSFGFASG